MCVPSRTTDPRATSNTRHIGVCGARTPHLSEKIPDPRRTKKEARQFLFLRFRVFVFSSCAEHQSENTVLPPPPPPPPDSLRKTITVASLVCGFGCCSGVMTMEAQQSVQVYLMNGETLEVMVSPEATVAEVYSQVASRLQLGPAAPYFRLWAISGVRSLLKLELEDDFVVQDFFVEWTRLLRYLCEKKKVPSLTLPHPPFLYPPSPSLPHLHTTHPHPPHHPPTHTRILHSAEKLRTGTRLGSQWGLRR